MGFYSLQIAKTGLVASQKALDVTGHNIANANTIGYTRQRLETTSLKGATTNGITVGAGVKIENILQIRDEYLDYQFRSENGVNSELLAKSQAMTYIENIIGEPSDHGINKSLSDFFVSVEEMTYNSHEISYRETVVQNAVRLTESVKTIATELVEYQKEINKDIEVTANQINGILDRIADLNKTIFNYEARGGAANDLRDQRNVLIDELSGYIDVEAYETSEGRMIINAGGTAIINDAYVRKIEVSPDQINPYTGEMLNSLHWEGTTAAVRPTAGTLKAMLDIRDGSSQEAQGIPYYLDQLNDLAASIVKEFNEINNTGWTIPYGSTDDTISRQGIDFFEEIGSNTTAALNMKVSEALLESGYNIALSSSELDSAMNWGNSENGLKFVALRDSNTLTYDGKFIGNFEEFFQKTVTDMAINKNYFDSRSASQQELTNFIESQRLAVSEVSIDEEMINLVQYQQAYNASAKLVQVVDEMLNTLMGIIR